MKLEIGKRYKLADGRQIVVEEFKRPYLADPDSPLFAYCRLIGNQFATHAWWNLDGSFGFQGESYDRMKAVEVIE